LATLGIGRPGSKPRDALIAQNTGDDAGPKGNGRLQPRIEDEFGQELWVSIPSEVPGGLQH
jgi:hypothetical protein